MPAGTLWYVLLALFVSLFATLCTLSAWSHLSVAQESAVAPPPASEAEAATSEAETPADKAPADETSQVEPEPASPGQADLDEATRLRLTASDGREIGKVIDLLNSAIKKGLDDDNEAFATQMLSSTYMERATAICGMLFKQQLPDPAQNPQWTQLRAVAVADIKKAVELTPTEFEGWLLLGKLNQLPQGNAEEAKQAFTKVIEAEEIEPKLKAEAYVRRSALTKDAAVQLADLSSAVECEPENVEYLLLRATAPFCDQKAQG